MNDNLDAITEKLTDLEFLKNVKRIVVGFVVVLLPIMYFGFFQNFSFEQLAQADFGVLTFMVSLSAWLVSSEAKTWAYDNSFKADDELVELEETQESNAKEIQRLDRRMIRSSRWITEVNKEKQQTYNEIKLQNKISTFDRKAITARLKGKEKKADRYEKRIQRYKQTGMFDKSFEPYDIKNIVMSSAESENALKKIRQKKGNAEIESNPKKVNPVVQLVSTLLRGGTVGVTAVIPFAWGQDRGTIIGFYVAYLIALVFTFLTNYLFTALKMKRGHKKSLKNTIALQTDLIDYLNKSQPQIDYKPKKEKRRVLNIQKPLRYKTEGSIS